MRKDVTLTLVGQSQARLWGLPLPEWQRRAWAKMGATPATQASGDRLLVAVDWVLSPGLQMALVTETGAALVVSANGQPVLVALHVPGGADQPALAAMVGRADPDVAQLAAAGFRVGDVADFAGHYNKTLRKREAPYALSLREHTQTDIEKRLFRGSYKGVTDLVTKYVWPLPAFHATRWAAARGIAPNSVTTLSLVMVIAAFVCFWYGLWIPGIAAAWAMAFLDTVDGKLARTTMTYSKWGDIYDHGIDLLSPPFWYWAMWVGLQGQTGGPSAGLLWLSLMVILVGYVLNRVQEGLFIKSFGCHIHVWEKVDSLFREVTARRNPNVLIFMLAVFAGAPGWGFVLVALWTFLCLGFHGVRLAQAYTAPDPVVSWMER